MGKYFLKAAVLFIAMIVCFSCVSSGDSTAADTKSMFAPEKLPEGVVAINDNTKGTGLNEFEYSKNGWSYGAPGGDPKYMNDDHYSGEKGSYFQFRFSGTNLKVYGTRDAHHGDAMVSIDGGAEVKVTYKSLKREYQYLIFDSGKLEPGEHIFKATVVGTGVITADRMDVTQ